MVHRFHNRPCQPNGFQLTFSIPAPPRFRSGINTSKWGLWIGTRLAWNADPQKDWNSSKRFFVAPVSGLAIACSIPQNSIGLVALQLWL